MKTMKREEFIKLAGLVPVRDNDYECVTVEEVEKLYNETVEKNGHAYLYSITGNEWTIITNGRGFIDNVGFVVGTNFVALDNIEVVWHLPSVYHWFDVKYCPERREISVLNKKGEVVILTSELPNEEILNNEDEIYGLKSYVYEMFSDTLEDMYEELESVGIKHAS